MKNLSFKLMMLGVVAFSITSCKDKDDDLPELPGGSGTMEQLSASESKEFLEKTANEALNMLNPDDQRDLIELCSYASEKYGDYALPENFDIEESYKYNIRNFFRGMADGTRSGDASTMTRAAAEYVYSIDFNNFKGIYEPNDRYEEWEKVGNSNDVIFRFKNYKGQSCELKATGSSNYSSGSFDWTSEGYWHDWDEKYTVNFKLPTEVNVSLTENNAQLATVKVNSNINVSGHTFELDVLVNAANIEATAKSNGNDSKVTETTTTTINGKSFVTTYATATGSHLCDISFYDRYLDKGKDYEAAFAQLFKDGEATVSVLNKVSVDGKITYTYDMWEALGLWVDDLRTAEKYVNLLNSNLTGIVRYNGTSTEQARIKWDYTVSRWGNYNIEPMLLFPDNTTYYFIDYFETGFTSIENLWNSLTRKYESVWNSVR